MLRPAVGDFQSQIGCLGNWDPACLRGFLADTDADGLYDVVTPPIAPGSYNLKVALNEAWTVNYGDLCTANGNNVPFTVPAGVAQPIYVSFSATTHCIRVNVGGRPRGDLRTAKAHWLDQTTIAWDLGGPPPTGATAELRFDPGAGLTIDPVLGLTGGNAIPLAYDPAGMPQALKDKFPHLAGLQVFKLASVPSSLKDILKGQLAIGLKSSASVPLDATSLQVPGVLDAVYAAAAKPVALGATWSSGTPTLRVWAPTAQDVKLELYADAASGTTPAEQPMTLDANTGVWSVTGAPAWKNQYYVYKVTVFTRATRTVVTNLVPDPYSVDASRNAERTHLVDLADPALKPAGWDNMVKPSLASPTDIVLYELHVRDFSATDATVPAQHQGKYLAFTDANSDGMKHLKALADAGLTHVHLLPVFDIASVNEDSSTWANTDFVTLRDLPPDAQGQQAAVAGYWNNDAFNWGYDPVLFGAPEGSYATNPNGGARVMEFRQMVQGLNAAGLRTVMDVVYNHTSSSGQNPNSVLDKIVPGYYHRLNGSGFIEHSTCCENTATEHAMMGKLTVDTLVTWAREFKVSSFRFDIMGHMPKQVVVDALTALRAVDSSMYLYGEGWNFEEVKDNKQFVQAKQADMAGTGVGTFNDRVRDSVRGGSPFSAITDQGFASGLLTDPNAAASEVGPSALKAKLLNASDLIRLSLAGNLKTYEMLNAAGQMVKGEQLVYSDAPGAGYTLIPQENISYVSAHDNMTIFDAVQVKAAEGDDRAARIRYNNLALAIAMLSQGVPFFHAGDEILRSKSGDNNSYNSGDWFNQIDWTLQSNGWGHGLPPQGDNGNFWPVLRPLLGDADLKPTGADIQKAFAVFTDFLRLRKAEPLFRLNTADAVQKQVTFYNVGVTQVPGLIVEGLSVKQDGNTADGDLVVVYNGTPDEMSWQSPEFAGRNFQLHPIQASGADPVVKGAVFHPLTGEFTVPGRTAAVFRQEPGNVKVLPETVPPTCSCSSTGPNLALGMAALALGALLARRRRGAAGLDSHSSSCSRGEP
ncbi:MAG TPA: pullulanase-type alpha-1,6-glucosidase [Myxococcales bacterium]|nr:pullulanase-type alpha-1,6-glucosidase [Myxococcales bacterium]